MNIFSIIGLVGTFVTMGISMVWGGVGVGAFLDLPSFFIVIVASLAILMFAGPGFADSLGVFSIIKMAFKTPDFKEAQVVSRFIALAEKARREGLLSLEDDLGDIDDDFIQTGLRLAIDGTDKDIIQNLLELELSKMQERHAARHRVLDVWALVGPACGMWGTIIGLVGMMKSLSSNPEAVGPNMAIALITTLYGSVLANAIAVPAARKLRTYDEQETNMKEMVIEGVLSIQAGDNPRILGRKLLSFLPPADRKEIESQMKD